MKTLQRNLTTLFKPAASRKPDPHRKARERAQAVAKDFGIEIECLRDGGFNVWPDKASQEPDPFDGDHYCSDWSEVWGNVATYAKLAL
jgi:hypothetical protein